MRKPLVAALAALALAAPVAPAAAQDGLPFISVKRAAAPRAVYVAALEALERGGYTLRARILDQTLLTLPAFASPNPQADETASVVYIEVGEAGDSTQLNIYAQLVRGDGKPVDGSEDGALAQILLVETMVSAAIDTALQAMPPGAGKPDPREDSDIYGYGRRNPIRVGGALEDGAARQRRWLDNLRGPGGERVRYRRLGSCCEFTTPRGPGALDAYEVTYDGLAQPVVLYLDMYTEPASVPPPPEGFTTAPPATPSDSE